VSEIRILNVKMSVYGSTLSSWGTEPSSKSMTKLILYPISLQSIIFRLFDRYFLNSFKNGRTRKKKE
jgi:hypothetical protein